MADLNGFDARTVDPSTTFDAIPAGKYIAAITESETKPTKNGNGSYLQLAFTIIEGEYKNRILWARLNLQNPNQTAVQIARSELSAICHAVSVMAPNDSVELHNLPLQIAVKVKKREDTGDLANEIKGYAKKEASQGQPQQAQNSTPPWRR
jgi:hypothetical protein